ncbi:maleylacetate reductase [Burkholderia sp. YR290]|uniref:iron-containing alcohol dehydrogenase n=1 Tax=Paraburkholderia hospita TaxID=169430 RepID=UPI0009A7EC2D|nr:iron-containing alcohol dehydrogenase [Paraburkholderia hospita]SKD02157.1 maleylacetate reductase [Paraburkholderia hospita]SOE83728.1 maleylacetate reductase [Burkholderia sp. YR290]
MRSRGTHLFPMMDRVIFGRPAAATVAAEAERLGSKRVFLIVSRTLNTTTPEIGKIAAALGERYAGVFDGVAQHTTREGALATTRAAREAGADLIVAVGGGSVVDIAKITTLCLEHNITEEDGLDGFAIEVDEKGRRKVGNFRGPSVRMIAVPSSLSGGEYNAACLVTDSRRKLKQTFFHGRMMPLAIILDPELLRHAPESLLLGSGTRAMDHAIEALCSPQGNPLVDATVLRGIELMREWLPRARNDRNDIEAATQCQIASWLCSFGLQARVPMGASHAIGHVLGGTCDVPHFLCTPVMMPGILAYNLPVTADAQKSLAAALGQPDASAADAFRAFCKSLGLPTSLREVDVGADQFELIARNTMTEFFIFSNPRAVHEPAGVLEILKLAA